MARRIMVPLDGSPLAELVLPEIRDLAHRYAAEVLLLRVVPTGSAVLIAASAGVSRSGDFVTQELDDEAEAARYYLWQVASGLRADGLEVHCRVAIGDPAEKIVEAAESGNVELILMSTHGRTGLRRIVLGSVAETVLRRTETPVFLVRPAPTA